MPYPAIPDAPNLPNPKKLVDSFSIRGWAQDFTAFLAKLLASMCYRLNRAVVADGSTGMTRPLPLVSYATADLPDATLWEGALVYVSDASAGSKLQYSDGTNWVAAG